MDYFDALFVAALKVLPTIVVAVVGWLIARAVKTVDSKIDNLAESDAEIKAKIDNLAAADTETQVQLARLHVRVAEIEAKLKGFSFRTPSRRHKKRKVAQS